MAEAIRQGKLGAMGKPTPQSQSPSPSSDIHDRQSGSAPKPSVKPTN